MNVQDIRAGTGRVMPELGANPLEVAFQDYQRMQHELAMATQEHAQKTDMVNDLLRENEFLRRNYDKAVVERDRYQALAVNLATRAVGVREAVERLLVEAVSARAAPAPVAAADGDGLESQIAALSRSIEGGAAPTGLAAGVASAVAVMATDWQPEPGVVKREITRRDTAVVPEPEIVRTRIAPIEYR